MNWLLFTIILFAVHLHDNTHSPQVRSLKTAFYLHCFVLSCGESYIPETQTLYWDIRLFGLNLCSRLSLSCLDAAPTQILQNVASIQPVIALPVAPFHSVPAHRLRSGTTE